MAQELDFAESTSLRCSFPRAFLEFRARLRQKKFSEELSTLLSSA